MKKKSIIFIASMLLSACLTVGIAQDKFVLDTKYYPPSGESRNVAIIFLGGSEGGFPHPLFYNVEKYAAMGYPCIVVAYFGTENTPDHLEMIPLEYFEEAIKSFKTKPEVGNKKIVVFGSSKGGELALLLASEYKQIEGVIAKVPSCVVFQGIRGPLKTSSWSFKGQPVPFVPYAPYDYDKKDAKYVEMYELSLEQTEAVKKATIKVENINGPILIYTGKEDPMWPSSKMGEMIIERLKENNFPHRYEHIAYENAGHSLHELEYFGGTKEGNKKARIDSELRILDFLRRLSEK